MDWGTILTALITGAVTLLGVILTNSKTQAVMEERFANYRDNTNQKIDDLTEHVEKHNGLVERMVMQEMNTESQWKRIDELKEEIEKLKEAS